ncbi:hypothetical protein AB0D04_07540 [Streptomyces sp. NPDC048483]|uniref:hypothetical protein n=1 Tax=Streptomyces sp. NPDC048483 TaxID=3154927 RepID=UPI003431AD74
MLKVEGKNFSEIGRDFYQATTKLKNGLAAQGDGGGSGGEAPKETTFSSVAQDAGKGLTTFSDKEGTPPWGDDELGEKSGVVYEDPRDGMTDSMEHLATKLNEIGKALERMAKNARGHGGVWRPYSGVAGPPQQHRRGSQGRVFAPYRFRRRLGSGSTFRRPTAPRQVRVPPHDRA